MYSKNTPERRVKKYQVNYFVNLGILYELVMSEKWGKGKTKAEIEKHKNTGTHSIAVIKNLKKMVCLLVILKQRL